MFKCTIVVNKIKLDDFFLPRVPVIGDLLLVEGGEYYNQYKVKQVAMFCLPRDDSIVAYIYCE